MTQLQNVLIDLAIAVIPIAGAYLIALVKQKTAELQGRVKNDSINKYIGIASTAVWQAVQAVSQTYVDALKKGGTFDADAQKQAFNLAKTQVISILGEDGKQALTSLYGDFNTYLDTLIESTVKQVKPYTPMQPISA